MSTTTKKDLIDRVAAHTQENRTAVKSIVQSFLDNVIVELGRGNRIEFRDFGVFEIKQRAPRVAQNPKTLERVPVPAKRTVKFKIGRLMRDALEGRLGHPKLDESRAASIETFRRTPGSTGRSGRQSTGEPSSKR
jgi:integration host factor subunit beta